MESGADQISHQWSPRNRVSMPPSEAWLSYHYLQAVQKKPLELPIHTFDATGEGLATQIVGENPQRYFGLA